MTLPGANPLSALAPDLPPLKSIDFKPPAGDRVVLDNGMVVYLMKDNTLPVVHVTAFIHTGKLNDPADKIGLGELTAGLLKDGGTEKYKPGEIDRKLEFLGASVETSIGNEEARADMTALKKDLDEVLDIYAQVLMKPAFGTDKVKIKRDEALETINRRNDDPGRAAMREAVRRFYGPDHPYGWRAETGTVNAATIADMKAYHANFYRPNNIILAAAGDFASTGGMLAKLKKKFGNWPKGEVKFPAIPPVRIEGKRHIYHIEKDIAQTFIVMLQKGVKRLDPIEYPLTVTNEMLGGGLSSRLAAEIRSRKGLAYSVYSYFAKKPDYGYIVGYCGTKPETYSQALSEMLKQFKLIKSEPAPAEEVDRARDSIVNSFVFKFPTPFELITERAAYEYYGYAPDYLDNYVESIAKTDPAAVLETAKKLFKPEDAMLLVIGSSKKFDKPLSDFGPVTELKEED
ncbi:MAG: insulinase family protein [Elusimicrobia bacterium CG08_land_8_20_14_0_20_59_10]|nr:MAG: insulinase family protein [Elusimicrobia bacterium CG08_land_8_20_14_0_20_59_10]